MRESVDSLPRLVSQSFATRYKTCTGRFFAFQHDSIGRRFRAITFNYKRKKLALRKALFDSSQTKKSVINPRCLPAAVSSLKLVTGATAEYCCVAWSYTLTRRRDPMFEEQRVNPGNKAAKLWNPRQTKKAEKTKTEPPSPTMTTRCNSHHSTGSCRKPRVLISVR